MNPSRDLCNRDPTKPSALSRVGRALPKTSNNALPTIELRASPRLTKNWSTVFLLACRISARYAEPMSQSEMTFGPFTFDPNRRLLTSNGTAIELGHRANVLLMSLLKAQGAPVTKADLMELVWPGKAVEEGNLTVQIAGLRKLLGPGLQGRGWIVTVPRVGYQLILPQAPGPEMRETQKPALAVLPFANLSGDPAQDYFADGIVEDIITALSRFKSFAVIARNSSFTYKGQAVDVRQVGQDLAVRYVLEGSIRRAGDRLRISAQLVECEGGQHIWAEHFDGQIDDVFDFQDRITESVAFVVEPHIQRAELDRSRRERPGSIAAYDLYLRALPKAELESDEGYSDAHLLLSEALVLEPNNSIILAKMAAFLGYRSVQGHSPVGPDDRVLCAELVHRALLHAGDDAGVLAYCADALMHLVKDYDWAMSAIQSAVEANPNNLDVVWRAGLVNLHCGSVADALTYFHRAMRLSPHDPLAYVSLTGIAHCHMVLGDFDAALTWAKRSLTLNPNYVFTYWMLIASNAQLGRMEEARKFLDQFRTLAPEVTIASIWAGQPQKDPSRCAAILDGLRLAGLAEA